MITFSLKEQQKSDLLQEIVKLHLKKDVKPQDRIPLCFLIEKSYGLKRGIHVNSLKGEEKLKSFFADLFSFYLIYWPYETDQDKRWHEKERYDHSRYVYYNCPSLNPIVYRCESDTPFSHNQFFFDSLKYRDGIYSRPEVYFLECLETLFSWERYQTLPETFSFDNTITNTKPFYTNFGYFLFYDKKHGRILLMYEGDDDEASMIFYP